MSPTVFKLIQLCALAAPALLIIGALPCRCERVQHKWKYDYACPGAVQEATAAIARNPRDADAYLHRAEGRGGGPRTLQLALEDISLAIRYGGTDARFYGTQASLLDELEEEVKALSAADMACKLDPSNAHYWHQRSVICYHLKRNDEALECADKAIRLDAHTSGYRQYKARALRAQGKWTECIAVLTDALKLKANNIPVLKDRMEAYTKLKQWNNAVADATTILSLEKTVESRRDILRARAEAHCQLKQYANAVNDLKEALKLFPDDRQSHAQLLSVYEKIGDKLNCEKERQFIQGVDEDFAPFK